MADAWDKVKAAETPVVAGALQPWLRSVTDLMGSLKPIIDTLAPVIADLGVKFDALVGSEAFTRFRDWIASFGAWSVGAAGSTIIDFFKAFMLILPQFTPLIGRAVEGIAGLGPAVLKWAGSKATADHITAFMDWFRTNGPAVWGLIKNLGGALAGLAPGLTSGGVTELNIISGFLGWVAKLPPAVAKPLIETAGALLLLNKLGVLSIGVKIVGAAAGWVQKLLGKRCGGPVGHDGGGRDARRVRVGRCCRSRGDPGGDGHGRGDRRDGDRRRRGNRRGGGRIGDRSGRGRRRHEHRDDHRRGGRSRAAGLPDVSRA